MLETAVSFNLPQCPSVLLYGETAERKVSDIYKTYTDVPFLGSFTTELPSIRSTVRSGVYIHYTHLCPKILHPESN